MTCTISTTRMLLAGTLATAMVGLGSHDAQAEVTYAQYFSTTNYGYKVIHMPDFDQRRKASADGSIPGLPNDGNMYCVPTSSMNVCAYIANHGFPNVPPEDYAWASPSTYNLATGSDLILGLLMGTSPTGGTGVDGWYNGVQAWVPLDQFTVSAYFRDDSWWPRRWDVAQSAISGGLVTFCWGWYGQTGQIGGIPVVERNGGHCVTLTEAIGGSTNARFWIRDPADDGANTTNSPWVNRKYWSESRSVYHNGQLRSVDNLVTAPGGGLSRIIDGYCVVRPKAGVTFSEPLQMFQWVEAASLLGALHDSSVDLPAAGNVTDFVVGLHQRRIYALVEFAPELFAVNCFPLDGAPPEQLDQPFGPVQAMALGTHHRLYIAADDQMHMVDVGGDTMQYLWAFPLQGQTGAMAYDDANDRVLVYDAENFAVITHPWHGDGESFWFDVPEEIAGENDGHAMAWDKTRNAVWMVAGGQPVAHMIRLDEGAVPVAVELPGASEVTSVDVDDQGHLFVADAGVLREYMQDDTGAWIPVEGPLFGMKVGRRARITRSRTNFDPAIHEDGWHNVLPEEFGEAIPDCAGDVDGDALVDFADLLLVLSNFGPCSPTADCSADLDGDDAVTFSDLLVVLSNWGPCAQ